MGRFTSPSLHVKDVLIAATLLAASALPASAQQDLEQCRWREISLGSFSQSRDGEIQLVSPKAGCQVTAGMTRGGETTSRTIVKSPSNGKLTILNVNRYYYIPKAGATSDEAVMKICGFSPAGSGCLNSTIKIVLQ